MLPDGTWRLQSAGDSETFYRLFENDKPYDDAGNFPYLSDLHFHRFNYPALHGRTASTVLQAYLVRPNYSFYSNDLWSFEALMANSMGDYAREERILRTSNVRAQHAIAGEVPHSFPAQIRLSETILSQVERSNAKKYRQNKRRNKKRAAMAKFSSPGYMQLLLATGKDQIICVGSHSYHCNGQSAFFPLFFRFFEDFHCSGLKIRDEQGRLNPANADRSQWKGKNGSKYHVSPTCLFPLHP